MKCMLLSALLIIFITQSRYVRSGLRIIGGRDAEKGKYPSIASLTHQVKFLNVDLPDKYIHYCTCAVLTLTWTLTAGHCVGLRKPRKINKDFLVTPVIRYEEANNSWMTSSIISVELYPAYRSNSFPGSILRNDIALVKTDKILLKEYSRVSAVDFGTIIGQEGTVVGYGITNSSDGMTDDAPALNKPLQLLDVVIVTCEKENLILRPAMCVARRCGHSAGACPGDSGGPMLHPSGVIGVNSMGPRDVHNFCALESKNPVFDVAMITPTSPYIDWISDVIKKDSYSFF